MYVRRSHDLKTSTCNWRLVSKSHHCALHDSIAEFQRAQQLIGPTLPSHIEVPTPNTNTMMKLALLAALIGTSAAFAPANLPGMLPPVSLKYEITSNRIDDADI